MTEHRLPDLEERTIKVFDIGSDCGGQYIHIELDDGVAINILGDPELNMSVWWWGERTPQGSDVGENPAPDGFKPAHYHMYHPGG